MLAEYFVKLFVSLRTVNKVLMLFSTKRNIKTKNYFIGKITKSPSKEASLFQRYTRHPCLSKLLHILNLS